MTDEMVNEPTCDGQVNTYDLKPRYEVWLPPSRSGGAASPWRRSKPRTGNYTVIYVNGMRGSPAKHRAQALMISAVSGGPVIGVYNGTRGVILDFLQSIGDKATTRAQLERDARWDRQLCGNQGRLLQWKLERQNRATAALFELLLRSRTGHDIRLVGHSQGNLIICNAVNALVALQGRQVTRRLRIYALASPNANWSEARDRVTTFTFSNDPIAWIGGNASGPRVRCGYRPLVARHTDVVLDYSRSLAPNQVVTHSMYIYLAEFWDRLHRCFHG